MTRSLRRMTLPTQFVLETFLHDPRRELYGNQVSDLAGLPTGTVHPILARLEGLGWLESRWEQIDPQAEKRPPRRYYTLSALGEAEARSALARAYRPSLSRAPLRPATERP